MTVQEALSARRSIRAFKSDRIDRDTLRAVLTDAALAPSWANSQPWDVFVAEGGALERIKAAYAEQYANAVQAQPDLTRPVEWTQAAKTRLKALYPDMLRDCGDAAGQFGLLNQRIFDAPCLVVVCMDKLLTPWSIYDIGAYSQSLMLSAIEHGLGSIPAVTSVHYPEVLRQELGIPGNLQVIIGIAVGYTDETNGINNFRSARDPIDDTVKFCE